MLALDEYEATVIRRYVDGANLAPKALLTYRPRTNADYGAAAASATVTAAQDGIDAAVVVSGRSNHDNLLGLLRNANPTRKVKSSPKKRTLTLA